MFERIRELRQQITKLVEDNNELLKRAAGEKRALTTDESQEFDKRETDCSSLRSTIEREERALEATAALSASQGTRAATRQGSPDARHLPSDLKELVEIQRRGINLWAQNAELPELEARALSPMARTLGPRTAANEQRATNIAGTGNLGGYMVPQGFFPELDVALKMFGSVLAAGPRLYPTDTGEDIPMPGIDDTSQTGELLTEVQTATQQEVAVSQAILKAWWFSSKEVPVSWSLLEDSAFDFNTLVGPLLGERLGRVMNTYQSTGTGTSQPKGVVTESSLGKQVAGQTAITYAEWLDLFHSMDPAYRQAGAKLMLSDAGLKMFRKVVDTNGLPIFAAAGTLNVPAGAPSQIDTVPVVINQDIAVPAAAAKSAVLGYFPKYVVRTVRGIELYRLLDATGIRTRTTGFLAYVRMDARAMPASAGAFKHLQQAA